LKHILRTALALKGLSHQSEPGYKWYGWKVQKWDKNYKAFKKFSTVPLTFNKFKQKRNALEKRDVNCHVFANSCWAILTSLLLADSGYLGISLWLSYTL
jgi:hypothetical protein